MTKTMKLPLGFQFAGVSTGIKSKPGARDVALVVSDQPCTIAGVFTTNQVVASPVVISRTRCPGQNLRGIVINSGNANACTGDQGYADAQQMCSLAAEAVEKQSGVSVSADQFLVMSTGIIGHHLPMNKIEKGIYSAAENLCRSEDGFMATSDAIMTTDLTRKIGHRSMIISGKEFAMVAMAKGAGMIGPKMATMLGIIVCDVPLTSEQAQVMLQYAADRSFNCISVEGHMSTNDSLVLMSPAPDSHSSPIDSNDLMRFRDVLTELCIELAKMIPDDGEGATHLMEIEVSGSSSDEDATAIAKNVAMSNLVKTAIFGGDPNWGRIVSATGYAGVPIVTNALALSLNGYDLFAGGQPLKFDAKAVSRSIRENRNTLIKLTVGDGDGRATHWTSDLGCAYVEFNSEYAT